MGRLGPGSPREKGFFTTLAVGEHNIGRVELGSRRPRQRQKPGRTAGYHAMPLTIRHSCVIKYSLPLEAVLTFAAIRRERHCLESLYANFLSTAETLSEGPFTNSSQRRLDLSEELTSLCALLE